MTAIEGSADGIVRSQLTTEQIPAAGQEADSLHGEAMTHRFAIADLHQASEAKEGHRLHFS